jgi:hypothetical protein
MPATYFDLRFTHYRTTLKDWFRGLDKALIATASALTFILTAIVLMLVVAMGEALQMLADPETSPAIRAAVIGCWQAVSLLLLRTLREATFMPRPRAFFDALPIPVHQKLRADLLLSLASYSVLWLPVAWVVIDPLHRAGGAAPPTVVLQLAELASLSLCVNLALLRGATRHALACLTFLACFALLGVGGAAAPLLHAGLAAGAAAALWHAYLPGRARVPRAARHGGFAERLVLGSGLVLGLLGSELRANLLVRVGFIAAALGGCLLVIRLRTNDASTASVVVFVAAVAGLALYTLPALCRRTLLTKAAFLAGQPAFARRMRFTTYAVPVGLYALAMAIAWRFDHSERPGIDLLVFSALFVLGITGARLGWRPTTWLMPFASMIALIVLAAMI